MKFTKLTVVALLLALLVCAFVACGGPTETGTGSESDKGTEPDVTEPDVTEPDVTEPDVTEPDVTEPDVTEPDVTEPDVTEPEVTYPVVIEPAEPVLGEPKVKLTDTFEGLEVRALTANDKSASGLAMKDYFTYTIGAPDILSIVEENGNKYLQKSNAGAKQIQYKEIEDEVNLLTAEMVEVSFDFRLDAEDTARGVFSFYSSSNEMRVLNIYNQKHLSFGAHDAETSAGSVDFYELTVGEWVNIRMVVDTTTFDYFVYVNNELVLFTTLNAETENDHLVYIKKDGAWVANASALYDVEAFDYAAINGTKGPFKPQGADGTINRFDFFRTSGNLACSIDNVTVISY